MIRRTGVRRRSEEEVRGTSLESAIALPVKYVMSLVGAAVSISGFVALLAASSVKAWVRSHPYLIYFALIVVILLLAGTLDYAFNMRKRLVQPTNHDTKLYAAVLSALAADGPVIGWLKRTDLTAARVTDFPADVLAALEKADEYARTRPVGFDNQRLAASFGTLAAAITSFCNAVDHWTIAARVSGDGTAERATSAALSNSHKGLVRAYDEFVRAAHASGIDTDG